MLNLCEHCAFASPQFHPTFDFKHQTSDIKKGDHLPAISLSYCLFAGTPAMLLSSYSAAPLQALRAGPCRVL
jgi:hypothetical protein